MWTRLDNKNLISGTQQKNLEKYMHKIVNCFCIYGSSDPRCCVNLEKTMKYDWSDDLPWILPYPGKKSPKDTELDDLLAEKKRLEQEIERRKLDPYKDQLRKQIEELKRQLGEL